MPSVTLLPFLDSVSMFSCILLLSNKKGDSYLGSHPNIPFKSVVRIPMRGGLHAFWSTALEETDFHETFSIETITLI